MLSMTSRSTALRTASLLSLVLGGSAGLLGGCTTADDAAPSSSEDALRVHPKGSENLVPLTIVLPTGTCLPGGNCSRPLRVAPDITVDATPLNLGTTVRLKPGVHLIDVGGLLRNVTLVAGQAKTYTLAAPQRTCQKASLPSVPRTDFGSSPSIANAECPGFAHLKYAGARGYLELFPGPSCQGTPDFAVSPATTEADCAARSNANVMYRSSRIDGRCWTADATYFPSGVGYRGYDECTAYLAGVITNNTSAVWFDASSVFVAGDYTVSLNGTEQTFNVQEGDVGTITIDLPVVGSVPSTFDTTLRFADPRELADAIPAKITSSCAGDRTYAVPSVATSTLALKAFVTAGCAYTLSAGGRSVTLNQSQPNDVTLHRLDVDDPEITRENGSTYLARGTYELYFGGSRVLGPVSTNTGVDVLPGTYELVVSFTTAEGPQTQRQTIQF